MFFNPISLQMAQPASLIPKCGECNLYRGCRSPKMEVSGDGRRKVLVVGEAPGAEEDLKGVQFVGKTGQYLRKALSKLGVNLQKDCWLTNALICRPPKNEIPEPRMVDWCRPNLIRTISKLKPDVILLLGKVAVQSLIPHIWGPEVDTLNRWVGWKAPSLALNAYVCPTWHPSHLTRTEAPALELHFMAHLRQAFALRGKPWPAGVPNYAADVRLLYTRTKIVSFLERIDSGTVAFDYETNMLKPDGPKAKIVCCSVCWNGEETVAFPMLPGVAKPLARLLTDKRVMKTAQNMKFEDRWTRKILGVQVRPWRWDTMLGAHLLDHRTKTAGLKFLAFVLLGQPKYDSHIEPYLKENESGNKENQIDQIPLDQLLLYNGLDSLLEYKIAEIQMKEMGCAI